MLVTLKVVTSNFRDTLPLCSGRMFDHFCGIVVSCWLLYFPPLVLGYSWCFAWRSSFLDWHRPIGDLNHHQSLLIYQVLRKTSCVSKFQYDVDQRWGLPNDPEIRTLMKPYKYVELVVCWLPTWNKTTSESTQKELMTTRNSEICIQYTSMWCSFWYNMSEHMEKKIAERSLPKSPRQAMTLGFLVGCVVRVRRLR